RRARRRAGSRHRGRGHPLPSGADDRARHDHRHDPHGPRLGRRRRAERPSGPGGHRRPHLRHHRHPRLRPRGLQSPPRPAAARPAPDSRAGRVRGSRGVWLLALGAVALGLAIYAGLHDRRGADAALQRATREAAVPTVAVIHPSASSPSDELVLPGTARAFTDAPIYARASGYLKKWYADIGSRVTQGQVLAEIETPELDQQLRQARAMLENARATMELARTTADRWQLLVKRESVSRQEADEKISDYIAKQAMVDSNAANVKRLEDLQGFQKVVAPFAGVVTARNTDIGALIDAGAGGQARELFRLAAIDRLRIFVSVPQAYAQNARPGAQTAITL